MRSSCLLIVLAACGARPAATDDPGPTTADGTGARSRRARSHDRSPPARPIGLSAKDPRVVDLDIIRITASTRGVGGEVETEHVATADLFKQATTRRRPRRPQRAIALYRRIVAEFPESQYAPVSLFNIAAISMAGATRRDASPPCASS